MKFKNPSPTLILKTFLLFFLANLVRDLQGLQTLLFSAETKILVYYHFSYQQFSVFL